MADLLIARDTGDNKQVRQFNAYVIIHDGQVKYVGVTRKSIQERWRRHLSDAKRAVKNSLIQQEISRLGANNFSIMHVASCVGMAELSDIEVLLIKQFNTFRNGYNLTSGGCQSYDVSDRTRRLLAEKGTGRKLSPETIAKISSSKKGKSFLTPEHLEKMMAAIRGKKRKLESVEKTAAALRGRVFSPESRAKMSASKLGRKKTPEVAAKTANALRGRKRDPSVHIKMWATRREKAA